MRYKKTIYTVVAVLMVAVVFAVMSKLNISFGILVKRVDFKEEELFKKFVVKDGKMGDDYVLEFKGLVAGTGDIEQRFFKVDITLVLRDKNSQRIILRNSKLAGAVIASTMGNFKVSDVSTVKGKQFLKSTIQKSLESKFGANSVKEIYFENFVYN